MIWNTSRHVILLVVLLTMLVTILSPGNSKAQNQSPDFRLGPQDTLMISVWKDEALTNEVIVRPDGKISFPLVGDIQAQGKTVEELRQLLTQKIHEFVPDAPLTVMVTRVGSTGIYVVGKVQRPGVYLMGQPLRVMQALALAGGTTQYAKKDDIIVIREEQGKQKAFKFEYDDVAEGDNLGQNILLQPGDTVVVP